MRSLRVRALFAALILIVAVPAGFGAGGGYQPPVGSGSGCVECTRDATTGEVSCFPTSEFDEQRWAGCEGGYTCYYMPGAGVWCTPNCGTRCNIA
jgi:hypothetical protein